MPAPCDSVKLGSPVGIDRLKDSVGKDTEFYVMTSSFNPFVKFIPDVKPNPLIKCKIKYVYEDGGKINVVVKHTAVEREDCQGSFIEDTTDKSYKISEDGRTAVEGVITTFHYVGYEPMELGGGRRSRKHRKHRKSHRKHRKSHRKHRKSHRKSLRSK
jgi:hypothetical protein